MGALQRQYVTESDAVAGAQDITSGLMRTRQVLAQQLEQTAGNMELLGERGGRFGGFTMQIVALMGVEVCL